MFLSLTLYACTTKVNTFFEKKNISYIFLFIIIKNRKIIKELKNFFSNIQSIKYTNFFLYSILYL
jgi:hypothetical protein